MKFVRLFVLSATAAVVLTAAVSNFAQQKAKSNNRRQSVSKTKKPVKNVASPQGQPAVAVTQIDFAGLTALLRSNSQAKRPLLVNFWATWCDPCREEFPELVKIDHEFRSRGLEFVTVSLDNLSEIRGDVPKFLIEMRAAMPAYLLKTADEDAAITSVAPDWKGGLPFTILFDSAGKTAYSRMGVVKPDVLRTEIEKVLPQQTNK